MVAVRPRALVVVLVVLDEEEAEYEGEAAHTWKRALVLVKMASVWRRPRSCYTRVQTTWRVCLTQ